MIPPQIPWTPQTNPANFPIHDPNAARGASGHPWPKMLLRVCTEEDREKWLKLNGKRDQSGDRELWYTERPPEVGSMIPVMSTIAMVNDGLAQTANTPVIVNDADEETRVLDWLDNAGILKQATPKEPVPHPSSIVIQVERAEPTQPEPARKKRKHRQGTKAK